MRAARTASLLGAYASTPSRHPASVCDTLAIWPLLADLREEMIMKRFVLTHTVRGKTYVALNIPEHKTMESYRACVRSAYGSLTGVTFGSVERHA